MRNPSKFSLRKLGRRKGDKLLLSGSHEEHDTSDFKSGVEIERDQSRNDDNNDPWLMMPYQLPIENVAPLVMNDNTPRVPAEDFSDKYSVKTNVNLIESKVTLAENHAQMMTNQDEKFMQFTTQPSGVDVFEDLESFQEENMVSQDSLADIMDEREPNIQRSMSRSTSNKKTITSFNIDADSSESSNLKRSAGEYERDDSVESTSETSNSADYPIDPRFAKKRGILIVDPQNNGEVYRMDENNKCLTDKELIIIGGDGEEDDDDTLMSNLTEVTYQRTKEERMKYLMTNLKDAASHIPESTAWCGIFECSPSNNRGNDANYTTDEEGKFIQIKDKGDSSMTQNAKLLFRSLFSKSGEKVDLGSFSEKIVVCITRIYLSVQNDEKDIGLRCTYNEPKLCHDLGVHLKEMSDGQAIVVNVLPESTSARSGVQVGDILSVSMNILRICNLQSIHSHFPIPASVCCATK